MTSTAANSSMPWLATACWKTWALPSKLVAIWAGRPTSAAASWIDFTASPSATPGARLNEIMTAGSWAMWLTVSVVGRVDGRDLAHAIGRVEQQADLVDRQAEAGGGIAIDVDDRRTRPHLE